MSNNIISKMPITRADLETLPNLEVVRLHREHLTTVNGVPHYARSPRHYEARRRDVTSEMAERYGLPTTGGLYIVTTYCHQQRLAWVSYNLVSQSK